MTPPQTLTTVTTAVRPSVPRMETVLASRWARVLIPSLSDLFFLAVLIWLFMSSGAAGWEGLLADADVGWHIRTGDYILSRHAVPRVDLYSFSKPGAPWYAWEWLTDVLDSGLHKMAGLKGIVLFAAVLIALYAWTLVRRMVRRDVHLFVALGVALLGVGGSSMHFLARPHLLTLLLLSISVWLIEEDRLRPSSRIWWLVPLTAVWTNLHGGFLALIAVLGLATVGSAIEAWFGFNGTIRDAVRYAKLTLACAAATLVNPYGWNLHRHVLEYLRSDWIRNVIQEFQSPVFRSENMLQFEALLLIGLIVAGAQFRRWKIVEGLWIVFWAHMALGSVRHAPGLYRGDRADHRVAVERLVEPGHRARQEELAAGDSESDGRRCAQGIPANQRLARCCRSRADRHGTSHKVAAGFSRFRVSGEDRARPQRPDPAIPRPDHRPVGRLSDLRQPGPEGVHRRPQRFLRT